MAQAECHYIPIESCLPENHPEWCYSSYKNDTLLKSSRDLLLIGQSPTTASRQFILYMTEGPKSETHPDFVMSMEIILFERSMPQSVNNSVADETHITPGLGVIECSISARIESATVTSSEIIFHERICRICRLPDPRQRYRRILTTNTVPQALAR